MAEEKKKEIVETPTKGERVIVKRPERELDLFRGFDTIFDDFRRSFDDLLLCHFYPLEPIFPEQLASQFELHWSML